jgi:glycerol kinase
VAAGVAAAQVSAIGIANQRETPLGWEQQTGKPLGNAVVGQCRITAAHCAWLTQLPQLDHKIGELENFSEGGFAHFPRFVNGGIVR